MQTILKNQITNTLKNLGLSKGDTVIVHTSLKAMGYVCGDAQTVIEALIDVVGSDGTIIMPTQSWKNLDPEEGVHWDVDKKDWNLIRKNWPAYDKDITPTNTMGATAEMFRKWPGAMRSEHPARSFAALGKHAQEIISNHSLENIFGDGSPLSKIYDLHGKVLLLGVAYDKNTSLHLADARASYLSKHDYIAHSAIMENGKRVWKEYKTLFVDGEDFNEIGAAFEKTHNVAKAMIGDGLVRLIDQIELVDFAVDWIEQNRK